MKVLSMLSIGVVVSMALGACTTITLERKDVLTELTPTHWKNNQQISRQDSVAAPISWKDFNDEILSGLLATALKNSPNIEQALLNIEGAKISLYGTEITKYPDYSASVSANTSKSKGSNTTESYLASVSISYEVDLWNKRSDRIKTSQLSLQNSKIDLQSSRILLAANVVSKYYSLRLLDEQLKVDSKTIELLEKELEIEIKKRALGMITGLAVRQKQITLQQQRDGIVARQGQRDIQEISLAILIGKTPQEFVFKKVDGFTLPELSLTAEAPSDILRARPDIRSAEIALAQSYINFDAARKAFYPDLNLNVNTNSITGSLSKLSNLGQAEWTISASIIEILLDNGSRERNVKQTKIIAKRQLIGYRNTILNALKEVESSLINQNAGKRRLAIQLEQLSNQSRVLMETQVKFNLGLKTGFELATQQKAFLDQQLSVMRQKQNNINNSIDLLKAFGVEPG